jgi:hypothetical protein
MNAAADRRGEQFHGLGRRWGADVVEISGPVLFAAVRQRLFPKNSPKMEKTDRSYL